MPFLRCGTFGKCFLGGAPLYLQILKLYVGGQIHKPMLTTGINNQMLHTKFQENKLVYPKRLILLCIMSKLLLQVIPKDPVFFESQQSLLDSMASQIRIISER